MAGRGLVVGLKVRKHLLVCEWVLGLKGWSLDLRRSGTRTVSNLQPRLNRNQAHHHDQHALIRHGKEASCYCSYPDILSFIYF